MFWRETNENKIKWILIFKLTIIKNEKKENLFYLAYQLIIASIYHRSKIILN